MNSTNASRGALVALLALVVVLLGAVAAHGHAVLLESTPDDGEAVEGAPDEIVLTFNERMQQPSRFVVTGPDGETVLDSEAEVDGERVRMPMPDLTTEGTYTVLWRVVSGDDHPVEGELTFEVTNLDAAEDDEPAVDPEPAPTPDAAATPDDAALTDDAAAIDPDDGGGSPLWWLLAGAVVLAVLVGGGAALAGRDRTPEA